MTSTTISTTINGTIVLDNNDNLTITSSGVINGPSTSFAVFDSGAIGTLTNDGQINGYDSGGLAFAAVDAGAIGTLINEGKIDGGISVSGSIGILTNSTAGTITSGVTSYGEIPGVSADAIGTLTNHGVIDQIDVGSVTSLDNTGVINSYFHTNTSHLYYGVSAGSVGTLTNSGTISVMSVSGTITSFDNETHGNINANATSNNIRAGGLSAGAIGTFTNSGQITIISVRQDIGSLDNQAGGVISGYAGNFTSSNAVFQAGLSAGSIGTLTNSGTINDGISVSGTIGTLTNTHIIGGYFEGNIIQGFQQIGISAGSIGTITNSGAIAGISDSSSLTSLDNRATGVISATSDFAISVRYAIGTLTNEGTINSQFSTGVYAGTEISYLDNSGTISGSGSGIQSVGDVGTLTNEGAIYGSFGRGVYAYSNITYLSNSGTISAGTSGTTAVGIFAGGTISTLTNSGTISAGDNAIQANDIVSLTNKTQGTITASHGDGVYSADDIANLDNQGAITANTGADIFAGGNIGTLTNSGALSGPGYAISAGGIDMLTNSGTIETTGGVTVTRLIQDTGNLAEMDNQSTGVIATYSETALFVSGTIGLLTNEGTISSAYQAAISAGGDIDNLQNTGLISGGSFGAAIFAGGTIGTLTNSGTISAGGNAIQAGDIVSLTNQTHGTITSSSGDGVYSSGDITNLNNFSFITGYQTGIYVGGNVGTLTNNGNIDGGSNRGISVVGTISSLINNGGIGGNTYIVDAQAIGTLTNHGTISGAANVSGNITSFDNYSGASIGALNVGGTISTFTNGGTFYFFSNIIQASGIGTFTNDGSIGSSAGQGQHVIQVNGNLTDLDNQGSISGNSGTELYVSGTIGTLTNEGTVSGNYGRGVYDSSNITYLSNSGTISADAGGSAGVGIYAGGTIGTLTNSGTISAGAGAIQANDIVSLTNETQGTITASHSDGVFSTGDITNLDNKGAITANTGADIYAGGNIGTLTNSGNIVGTASGIVASGTIGTLTNSGTITAGQAAIGASNIVSLTNQGTISSTFAPAIYSSGTITNLDNSGTINSRSGEAIYAAGNIGTLTNTGSINGGGPTSSTIYSGGSIGTLINSGYITASNDYLLNVGSIGTLDNSGEMQGRINVFGSITTIENRSGGDLGELQVSGTIGTLSNNGHIIYGGSSAITASGIGTFTNDGTISANSMQGQDVIQVNGDLTDLDNQGSISGNSGTELYVSGTIGTLTNEGTVNGSYGRGVYASSNITYLSNSGTIYAGSGGTAGVGIYAGGTIGTLTNSGEIYGGSVGINAGGSADIENAGTIFGGSDAILLGGASSTLTLDPTSFITGTVQDRIGDGTLDLAGSTANTVTGIGTQYVGFDTINLENPDSSIEGNEAGLASGQTINGFHTGDTLTLDGFTAVSGTYVAGTGLVLSDGNMTVTIDITGNFAPNAFTVVGNSTNGTTMVEDVPCYLRGTRILTARGQVPVEHLQEGDLVATFTGQDAPLKPIKWIGHTNFDAARHPNPAQVWPVRIRKNAFGDGAPLRDLLVSPGHSVLIDGVLIQAERLINGATIFQDRSITQGSYFHVELPAHDIILSEGLLAESYLDTGNRHSFKNAAPFIDMHPDFSPKHWSETCRELVMSGDRLIAARAHLLNRAHALGYATKDPGIHLLSAHGQILLPASVAGRRYTFHLPQAGYYRLASRSWLPAEHLPESKDTRQLGVRVWRILVGEDQRDTPLDSQAIPNEGWHNPEGRTDNRWRWTKGLARLPWASKTITIDLTSATTYWADEASSQENEKVKASA